MGNGLRPAGVGPVVEADGRRGVDFDEAGVLGGRWLREIFGDEIDSRENKFEGLGGGDGELAELSVDGIEVDGAGIAAKSKVGNWRDCLGCVLGEDGIEREVLLVKVEGDLVEVGEGVKDGVRIG